LTIRICPNDEQWVLLRQRAAEAAAYRNKFMQAYLADALKWRTPEGAGQDKIQKVIRATEGGVLSSSVTAGAEAEVTKDWQRMGRAIMAGAAMPQYRQKESLCVVTRSGTSGVKIIETADGFIAQLHLHCRDYEGETWLSVPVHPKTDRDEFRWPKLQEFARGTVTISVARVVFKLYPRKTLLQLTYAIERTVMPIGQRIATLSEFEDGRLLLRAENGGTLDFSSRLAQMRRIKADWDGLRRRFGFQASRRKRHARQLRRKLESFGLANKFATILHQWSAEMVKWMVAQGCGEFTVPTLVGGDWPAHQLLFCLRYKCEDAGIKVVESSLSQEPTERAAAAVVRKRQHKARKLGNAVREIEHQLIHEKSGDMA
jgi:hypothetical protein